MRLIVSFISPRKGQGQTITSIMLGSYFAKMAKQDVCLIDTNKVYSDMDMYLSNACITRGLDDFCKGATDYKRDCARQIQEHLYLSISSPITCMDGAAITRLTEVLRENFKATFIDCASMEKEYRAYLDNSDTILVVIEQNKGVINALREHKAVYKPYLKKIVFVVNRTFETMNGRWVNYDVGAINKDLEEIGFTRPIISLPFSASLLNECNNGTPLHFIHGETDTQYLKELNAMTGCLLDSVTFQKYFVKNKYSRIAAINRLLAGGGGN